MSNIVNALYKVVKKVIVPEYPWIKDFYWTYYYNEGREYYSLEIIVDNDFYYNRTDTRKIYDRLYTDTKMLFKMIGPDENVFFDDVTINPEDYRTSE